MLHRRRYHPCTAVSPNFHCTQLPSALLASLPSVAPLPGSSSSHRFVGLACIAPFQTLMCVSLFDLATSACSFPCVAVFLSSILPQLCRTENQDAIDAATVGALCRDCRKQVYLVCKFDLIFKAYDRAAIKFCGIDADINFNISDYDEDIKQRKAALPLRDAKNGNANKMKALCGKEALKNQVMALKEKGIDAEFLSSTISTDAKNKIHDDLDSGKPSTRLLYVTPELIATAGRIASQVGAMISVILPKSFPNSALVFTKIKVLVMKPDALRAGVSASDTVRTLGVAPAMANEHLLSAESKGLLCRDISPDGFRFYINLTSEIAEQAKRRDGVARKDPSFKPQGGQLWENDMDYDTDKKSMATLRRHLRGATEEYYRYKSQKMSRSTFNVELDAANATWLSINILDYPIFRC
ncbi:hypothetical protein HN873_063360 [Arachis hypogaea]